MRRITVLSMISLDGVMQAPGGPAEDKSGDFRFGGWVAPFSDGVYNEAVRKELEPADYLLGRKTFEIWAEYWPKHNEGWPGINSGRKFVYSTTLSNSDPLVADWSASEVINTVSAIKALKNTEGPNLQVWGSSQLVQLLLANDLVDELRLKIHPIVLGPGKRLFDDRALAAAFSLIETSVTTTGVIIASYIRSGDVETGQAGPE